MYFIGMLVYVVDQCNEDNNCWGNENQNGFQHFLWIKMHFLESSFTTNAALLETVNSNEFHFRVSLKYFWVDRINRLLQDTLDHIPGPPFTIKQKEHAYEL